MLSLKKGMKGFARQRSELNSPPRRRLPSQEKNNNRYEKVKALSQRFKLPNKTIYELEAEYSSMLEICKRKLHNEFDFLKDNAPAKQTRKSSAQGSVKPPEKDGAPETLPLDVYLMYDKLLKDKHPDLVDRLIKGIGIDVDGKNPQLNKD